MFLSLSYKPNPVLLPGSTHSSFSRKIFFVLQKSSISTTLPLKSASKIFTDSPCLIVCFLPENFWKDAGDRNFFSLTSASFFHLWEQKILSSFKCSGWNYIWISFPICFDCFLLIVQHRSCKTLKIYFNEHSLHWETLCFTVIGNIEKLASEFLEARPGSEMVTYMLVFVTQFNLYRNI